MFFSIEMYPFAYNLFILLLFVNYGNSFIYRNQDSMSKRSSAYDLGKPPTKYPTDVIIEMDGYASESHYVTTSDGYILNIHRIPTVKNQQSNGKVAFLQHGIEDSSAGWLLLGPNKSLAYMLANNGYDVWLGNARGNFYSRNHTTLNPDKDKQFWHFSWHEIGIYDLPAVIDYILEETKQKSLYYIGHSQGSTSMYVMCSSKPEYNKKIKIYAHLSPIAYMNNLQSALLRAISTKPAIKTLAPLLGTDELIPKNGFINTMLPEICAEGIGTILCRNILFALFGISPEEINISMIPLIMVHLPAGSATRQLLHYGQEIKSGHFCQYDHGIIENMRRYNQLTPPDYNLSEITAPGYLFYAKNDRVCAITDVERLYGQLKTVLGKILVPVPTFNHLDYIFGKSAPSEVYEKVLKIFLQY